MRGRCELKACAGLLAASSEKTHQKHLTKPPILTQSNRRNQLLIGPSEPNLPFKNRAGNPYTAGVTTRKTHAPAAEILKKFSPGEPNPEPEPHVNLTWPANPTKTPKPYPKALTEPKTLAKHTAKTTYSSTYSSTNEP